MADTRKQGVWSGHASQQMQQEAYTPGDVAHPDRLSLVLNSEGWGSVLDFGCGTALWRRMFPADKWYVGLDQNPDMIAGARQRFPEDEFLLVPGIVDGAKIPMEDGGVDVVFTSAVLQHCTDADKAPVLREIRRMLEIGGRLIMFENTYWEGNPGQDDGRSHTQDGWKALLEPFGFTRVSIDGDLHVFRAV